MLRRHDKPLRLRVVRRSLSCRHDCGHCPRNHLHAVRHPALWHQDSGQHFFSNYPVVAVVQCHGWHLQHAHLWSRRLQSLWPQLLVCLPAAQWQPRMEVTWRGCAVHYRYSKLQVFLQMCYTSHFMLYVGVCAACLLHSFGSHHRRLLFESFCICAGAEALFADLGHFSMRSIQVKR